MRNYIILNGVRSDTIPGLIIQSLAPITKPRIRTEIEEIDGRDGDIVTKLGYSAYDKEISVGLSYNYDINEVINFFNSEGQVIFSNENDKYYNYQILEQIDFEKLLRFKTATVTFHVQPFKYPTEEEPLVEQYQYVSDTGSDLSIDNTASAVFKKIDLKGNTIQNGTPSSNNPVDVLVVTGNNTINIVGKNLANVSVGNNIVIAENLKPGTYTFSLEHDYSIGYILKANDSSGTTIEARTPNGSGRDTVSFTISEVTSIFINGYSRTTGKTFSDGARKYQIEEGSASSYEPYTKQSYNINLGGNQFNINTISINKSIVGNTGEVNDSNVSNLSDYIKVVEGKVYHLTYDYGALLTSADRDYCYYNEDKEYISGGTYTSTLKDHVFTIPSNARYIRFNYDKNISLINFVNYEDDEIKLCENDYFYKEDNKWYKYNYIGYTVLDGNETITRGTTSVSGEYRFGIEIPNCKKGLDIPLKSTHFVNTSASTYSNRGIGGRTDVNGIYINDVNLCQLTLEEFKTWLSTHYVEIYYQLSTPTITEITSNDLIEQLEAVLLAYSDDKQTNINQEYTEAPFILDVSAVKLGTDIITINNVGNIYSKPIIDIQGTGIINVYLGDTQMFQVDLNNTSEIVIDTNKMEAYNPTNQALMNRKVIGNYDNFKLNAGQNNLKFSGDLTQAIITNYTRWL